MADFLIGRIVALDRLVLEDLAQAKLDQASALQAEAAAFIALLDRCDGDPDLEEDDPHGACDEDEISCGGMTLHWYPSGPGCEISDTDCDAREGRS